MIVGDVELTGDLVIEGRLTGVDAFHLRGNGFQIVVQHGGTVDLRGQPKSGWIRGGKPSGWARGDRVVTAPVGNGDYKGFKLGSWPVSAPPAVRLADGRSMPAEQFNLDRSIVIEDVSRFMFHMGAGPSTLRHIAVRNSGITGRMGFYSLHWHLNGNSTRGTLVEGVVVEGGRNHAFVPHGSHGITFVDCVAYDVIGDAYWWDPPGTNSSERFPKFDTTNNSNDTVWKHCLAALVSPEPGTPGYRLSGFVLGAGSGNQAVDCTAVGVQGGKDASGFHWPEGANQNVGGNTWVFRNCVAHNNRYDGIFVWQNDGNPHVIDDFVAYRCGGAGIDHGAYINQYRYRGASITGCDRSVIVHALSDGADRPILFEAIHADGPVEVVKHSLASDHPVVFRRCTLPKVIFRETSDSGRNPGSFRFEDCGLDPGRFDLSGVHPDSVIELMEGGKLVARWSGGSWS
ncbi:MAG: hypothetical protein KatS3mg011_0841 [Acidimicrobiia bacterium]|nr:MAG: hypothetical protein KatS3mg011_0841 [Acidimicrobiia bacterium]